MSSRKRKKDLLCEPPEECQWESGKKKKKTDPLFGPILKKMTGFHHLDYFDNLPGGRKILLLGESHDTIHGCPTCTQQEGCSVVTDYLKKLDRAGKRAGRCLDVFVESNKHKKDMLGGDDTSKKYQIENVGDLRRQFTYLTQAEKKTQYPNTRFHDWDLRHLNCGSDDIYRCEHVKYVFFPTLVKGETFISDGLLSSFNEYPGSFREKARLIFDYYVTGYQLPQSEEFVTSLIKQLPGYTESIHQQNIKHFNYARYKIQKAVEKIDTSLNPYFIRKNLFDRYFDIWWDFLLKHIRSSLELDVDNARNFFMLTSCFMTDLYLFARMFSVFQKSKQTEGVGCLKQMYPKNIIVYGGSIHIQLVSRLIQDIFGGIFGEEWYSKHHYKVNRSVSCIEFTEAMQFF